MHRFLIGAAAAAIVAVAPALAENVQPGHAGHAGGMMAKTETRADVQGHIAKMFSNLDTNKDGFVTTAEADAARAQHIDKVEHKMEQRAEHFDPAKMMARLDTNKDGKLTKAEVDSAHQAKAAAGKPAHGSDKLFARVDTNKDGVITANELQAMKQGAMAAPARLDKMKAHDGRLDKMLGQADLNKDGKVSLAEAQQSALQHFDRADANHDGKLTPDERRAAWTAAHPQPKG